MAGYIRQSTFVDGDTITAALFNDEYNQLVNAFSNTSGHKHDGTTAEGPVIGLIGDAGETSPNNKVLIDTTNNHIEFYVEVSSNPVQQIYIADGAIVPVTDSDVDLGTSSLYFKDAYIDTVTTTGNVSVGGNLTVTGTTTFNGGTITMGDAATDNVVFGADVDSHIIPDDDDTYDLGSSTQQWRNLYIDGTAEIDTLAINGTTVTSTAAELNILDGVTSTAAELNILDGVTSTAAELNILDGKAFLDEDDMSSNSATGIASQQSIKAYVDTTVAATNEVVEDSTPQLGGNLDLNSNDITGTGNINITGTIQSSGNITGTLATAAQPNITSVGTLTTLTVDDITINASTISDAGDLTIDVGGDLNFDADGGDIFLKDGGTSFGKFVQNSSNFHVVATVQDKDIKFFGNDGGSSVTALTLDMSDAGKAIFNAGATFGSGIDVTGTVVADGLTVDTSTLVVDATNNRVGIGTTSPEKSLHVAGLIDNGGIRLTSANDTNTNYIFFGDTTSASVGRIAYDHTNNRMEFFTNGSQVVNIDSSGNVGIGTDSPQKPLHINSATGNIGVRVESTDATSSIEFMDSGTTSTALSARVGGISDDFFVQTNGLERMRIDSSGNVGIGTTSPSQELHIEANNPAIQIKDTSTTGSIFVQADYASSGTDVIRSDTNNLGLYADGAVSIKFNTNATERMRIDSSGDLTIQGGRIYLKESDLGNNAVAITRDSDEGYLQLFSSGSQTVELRGNGNSYINGGSLGIGTTSPSESLHTTGNIRFGDSAPAELYTNSSELRLGVDRNNDNGTSNVTFYTNNDEKVRIDADGNVGIGTTNPQAELHVEDASGNCVVNIESATTGYSALNLGDTNNDDVGQIKYDNSNNSMQFTTDASEAMRIDSSGNVGIGETSPSTKLHIKSSAPNIRLEDSDTNSYGEIVYNTAGGGLLIRSDENAATGASGSNILFETDSSERVRIDSSGNLLVGKTSANDFASAGVQIEPAGQITTSIGGDAALKLNRGTNDGNIIELNKAGSLVGSIATVSGDLNIFAAASGHKGLRLGAGFIAPTSNSTTIEDASTDLGISTARFRDLHLSGTGYFGTSVGIGTTSPSTPLHVSASSPELRLEDSDDNGFLALTHNGNNSYFSTSQGGILFRTNSTTERMRLNSSGILMIGTTSTTIDSSNFGMTLTNVGRIKNSVNVAGAGIVTEMYGNAGQFIIKGDGDAENTNNSYGAISDERLKENIADATPKLEKLKQVQIKTYNLKAHPDRKQIGVIAQELESVFPSLVKDNDDGYKTVKYSVFVPMLIKAMQEQQTQIEALQSEINNLKGE